LTELFKSILWRFQNHKSPMPSPTTYGEKTSPLSHVKRFGYYLLTYIHSPLTRPGNVILPILMYVLNHRLQT